MLNDLGVSTYAQIAGWNKSERDGWLRQAKALAEGGVAEYVKVFGKRQR